MKKNKIKKINKSLKKMSEELSKGKYEKWSKENDE